MTARKKTRAGRLITLEGGEGAGKSTQLRYIAGWLRDRGHNPVTTREPGGSPLAEALRTLVLSEWPGGISARTETLLMFAARAAHLEQTILPALASGHDVICDRFIDSTYAYQGAGKKVKTAQIRDLERLVLGRLKPDLTILLDLPPEIGLQRTRNRGEQNRFEAESLAFMGRVRRAFLRRARAEPRRFAIVDARADAATVSETIGGILEQRL